MEFMEEALLFMYKLFPHTAPFHAEVDFILPQKERYRCITLYSVYVTCLSLPYSLVKSLKGT